MDDPYDPYNDEIKQRCWNAAAMGYDLGYGVEDLEMSDWKTLRSRFERHYTLNQ